MKKKLASLLVFALVFTMLVPSFALAAGEDAKGHKYEASIKKLIALGIVAGDAGTGNIRPDDELTRAEFAKIAAYAGGYAKAAEMLSGLKTGFKDVKADHWAAGYIALAASKGYLKGDPNGNFRPEDKITVAEAVTVLLRILGYNDNLPGSWPSDYITQAAVLGLFDNVQVAASAKVKRGEVFALTDVVLNQYLVVYNKDTDRFDLVDGDAGLSGLQTKTLLAASFSDLASAVVTETKAVFGSTLADNKIKVRTASGTVVEKELASDVVFEGFADVNGLLGHTVKYIELGGKVKFLMDATAASKIVTGEVESVTQATYNVDLKNNDAISYADNALVFRNYKAAAKTDLQVGDNATLVLDSSGKVQAVLATKFTNEDVVVKSVSAATTASPARITFDDSTTVNLHKDAVIIRNGAKVTLADLQKNDVVSYIVSNGEVIYVDAVAKTVTGKVTGKKSTTSAYKVTVDGVEYTSNATVYTAVSVGSTYTFYLGHDDSLVKQTIVSGNSNVITGILVENKDVNVLEGNVVVPYQQLTIITAEGKKEVRTVVEDTYSAALAVKSFGDFTFSKNSSGQETARGTVATGFNDVADGTGVFSYNKNTKVATLGSANYFVTDSTVVFNVTNSDPTKWTVINVDDLHGKTGLTAEVSYTNFNANYIFVKGSTIASASDRASEVVGIIVGKSSVTTEEGTKHYIDVNVKGVVNSYELESAYTGSTNKVLVSVTDDVYGTSGVTGKLDTVTAYTTAVSVSATDSGKVYFTVGGTEYALTSASTIYIKKADGTIVLGVYDDLTATGATFYVKGSSTTVVGSGGPGTTANVVDAVLIVLP